MQKKYTFLFAIAAACLMLANSANPPDGRTGAPGDGLCSDCHSLNGGTQDGSISLAGFPATIVPNQAYVLTITNSNPNGVAEKAGFQMVVLNSSNQNVGDLSSPGPASTTESFMGREYWEHDPSQNYPGSNMVTWTVTWTAPAGPVNELITWYAAGNIANANGETTGDLIVTANGSGTLLGGADPLFVEITSFTDILCNGDFSGSATAQAFGGTQPYAYLWSNGQPGETADDLGAGTYTVTVTDNTALTATAEVTIAQPAALVFDAPTIQHVSCFGDANGAITVSASGGVPPYAFAWSTGASGSSIAGLAAGTYGVTVTDNNDCTNTTTYTVTQPAVLQINLFELENESCFGAADGSITIAMSGGTSPYFAEWSNGFIGNAISDLEPGDYSVTVTDNNNCTATSSYVIEPGSEIDVEADILHVTCGGGNDGEINASAFGGTGPYAYSWSNGANTPMITGLAAGSYLLTVTDATDCSVIKLYTVNQPTPIVIQIIETTSIQCFGDSTADLVAIILSGGVPPFSGVWSGGETELSISDVPSGMYAITITDVDGCTAAASVVVTQPTQVTAIVLTEDESAPGANDGVAIVNPSGGTGGYSLLWSTGASTDTITGLSPGTYTITVTDDNGCTGTGSGQVDAFGCVLELSLGSDVMICEGGSAEIMAVVAGAEGLVSYTWSTGDTTATLTVSAEGEYCLTVTDELGCQDADCIIISLDTVQLLSCGVTHESAPGAQDGSIICEPNGEIIAYLWNTGATTPSITGLPPGEYCVTLTNAQGCTAIQCFIVQAAGCNMLVMAIFEDVTCFGDTTGSISLNVQNAEFPVTFLWSTGDTTSAVVDLGAGSYEVSITDALGCLEVRNYTIAQPENLLITVDSIQPITDVDQGALFITVSGGVPPYGYEWTLPDGSQSTVEDLSGLTVPGGHFITVSDANGCGVVGLFEVPGSVAVPTIPKPQNVSVYPVPATDWLQLVMPAQAQQVWLTAIDGRVVRQYSAPSGNRIDVSGIESGWYVLTMYDGTSWYVARMVK